MKARPSSSSNSGASLSAVRPRRHAATAEARPLTELARAAGLGDAPDEALDWHARAIRLLGTDEETPLLADVIRWQAAVLRDRGEISDAEPLFRQSLEMATRLGYDTGRAHAINHLGSLALRRGDLVAAAAQLSNALDIAQACGETRLVGMLQQNLGVIADIRGNPASAFAHYRLSLHIFEATNDLQLMCWVMNNLGYFHMKEGQYGEAHAVYDRATAIARVRGDLVAEGFLEENRAELLLTEGRIDEAPAPTGRALAIAELRGDRVRRAATLKLRGAHERLTQRPLDAVTTLSEAMTLSAMGEDALLGAELLYQFGMALQAAGDSAGAQGAWESALEAFEGISARQWVTRVRERLSDGDCGRYL